MRLLRNAGVRHDGTEGPADSEAHLQKQWNAKRCIRGCTEGRGRHGVTKLVDEQPHPDPQNGPGEHVAGIVHTKMHPTQRNPQGP